MQDASRSAGRGLARPRNGSQGGAGSSQGGAAGSTELLALQAFAGNAAVVRALGHGKPAPAASRHGPGGSAGRVVVARQPKGNAGGEQEKSPKDLGRELEARIDAVLAVGSDRHKAVIGGIQAGVVHIDASVTALNAVATVYGSAYDSVKRTINEGKGQIAAQEAFAQAILGIAIGAGVGMALGAVTVFAKSASQGAELVGKVLTEIGGETAELGVGKGLEALGPSGGGAGEAFLERMNPALRRLEIYHQASEMYRELALLATRLGALGALAKPAAALKADSRELAVRGALSGTGSVEQLRTKVATLESAGAQAAAVDAYVKRLVAKAGEAQTLSEREVAAQDERRMERQLWLRWMTSLSGADDMDVLRSGPVRGAMKYFHLLGRSGSSSDIGWDAGVAYTESESKWGIDIARQVNMALDLVGKEARLTGIRDTYSGGPAWGEVDFGKAMPWYKRQWEVMVDAQKDWVDNGARIRITHVWGRGDKRPWLYGRLVTSSEPDRAWNERARYRRELM